jgi:hypothetical protein
MFQKLQKFLVKHFQYSHTQRGWFLPTGVAQMVSCGTQEFHEVKIMVPQENYNIKTYYY